MAPIWHYSCQADAWKVCQISAASITAQWARRYQCRAVCYQAASIAGRFMRRAYLRRREGLPIPRRRDSPA
jgi:hypothetical protein